MAELNTRNPRGNRDDLLRQRLRVLFLADLFRRLDLPGIAERSAVACSVRKARITENTGEMILELRGLPDNLARLRQLLAEQGMEVELIEEEQIT